MNRRHLSGLGKSVPTGKGDLWGLGTLGGRNSGPGNGVPMRYHAFPLTLTLVRGDRFRWPFSDLERRNARAKFSPTDLRVYARTVWLRTTKFGTVIYAGRGTFQRVSQAPNHRVRAPASLNNFGTSHVSTYGMRNGNQILLGDQSRWAEIINYTGRPRPLSLAKHFCDSNTDARSTCCS